MLLPLELVASERGVSCTRSERRKRERCSREPTAEPKTPRHFLLPTKGRLEVADLEVRGTHTSLTAWSAGALIILCPSLVITPYTTTTSISSNLGVAVFRVCALVGLDPCRPCRHADDGALRSGSFELVPRHDEPLVRLAMVSGIGQGVAEAVSEGTSASTRASVSQSVKQRGCTRSRWPVYRPYNCSAVGEQRQHGSIAGAS